MHADSYDELDAHIAAAGDIARASVPMGMLLAWCTNMQLLAQSVVAEHEQLILRLRFHEVLGSELLIACGGDLRRDLFNANGQRFLDGFYARYPSVFRSVFGDDLYSVTDDLDNYQILAKALAAEFFAKPDSEAGSGIELFKKVSRWLKG